MTGRSDVLPLVLDAARLRYLVVGSGPLAQKRLALLKEARAAHVLHHETPPEEQVIASAHILLIAGLPIEQAEQLAETARRLRVLVNVEDVREYCDFHVPALLRRGALVFAVSTGGGSPTLARRLRDDIAQHFGPEWDDRLQDIARQREVWRTQGKSMQEVGVLTDAYLREKGWVAA